ncbi:MAG: 4Fe-4S binding protein [Nitrososphaerota archaeon]|nr:4Fe-4S binding protein [Nitrososphaerota archaeon]
MYHPVLRQKWDVIIDADRCKGCEICVNACSQQNLELSKSINGLGYHYVEFNFHGKRGDCTGCNICYTVCPDYSILEVVSGEEAANGS